MCAGICGLRGAYRDLEEMMAERGLSLDHTTIYRLPCSALPQRSTNAVGLTSKPAMIPGEWTRPTSKSQKPGCLSRAVDSEGNTLEFLLSPTRDAEAAKRFFEKALPATACSAPQGHPIEEQVAQPTATADPNPTKSAPRVINVAKNAADPKAMAELKAAGILPEQVELKPGQICEEPDRARPPLHQAVGQACDGLLFC